MVTSFVFFKILYDFETFFSYIGPSLFRFIMVWVLEWTSEAGAMTSVSSRKYNVQLPRAIITATYCCEDSSSLHSQQSRYFNVPRSLRMVGSILACLIYYTLREHSLTELLHTESRNRVLLTITASHSGDKAPFWATWPNMSSSSVVSSVLQADAGTPH
jgi:hypothetical protein